MTILLTKEEAELYKEFGPASPKVECLRTENVCQDKNYKDPWRWIRIGQSYSDGDAKRVVEGLQTFREMYAKRISDELLEAVFDVAEESQLSVVVILACMDNLVKTQKAVPSLAHFVEAFDDLRGHAHQLYNTVYQARQKFWRCSDNLRQCLTSELLKRIRLQIPDFPDVDELAKAWESVLGVPIGTFYELADTERVAPLMIDELRAAAPWPMVPLYCISLVAKIPPDERGLAAGYYEHLNEDGDVGATKSNSPMIWRRVVAGYSTFENEDSDPWHHIDESLADDLLKPDNDEIAALWEREKSMLKDIP